MALSEGSSDRPAFSWWKHRLYISQQVLSECLNVPMRCLRGDAFEALRGVLDDEGLYSAIDELASKQVPDEPLREVLSRDLISALSPRRNTVEASRMSLAFWLTPRSAASPFYDELKNNIRRVQALLRLNILRKLRWIQTEGATGGNYLALPAGLVGVFSSLQLPGEGSENHILIVGPARLLDQIDQEASVDARSRAIALERQARSLVQKANEIRGEGEKEIGTEDQTNLLVLSTANVEPDRHTLELKAEAAVRVLRRASELEAANADLVDNLSTTEWRRVVQWLYFWQSRHTLPVLGHHLNSPDAGRRTVWSRPRNLTFLAEDKLSGSRSGDVGPLAIRVRGELPVDRDTSLDVLSFEICESDSRVPPGRLRLELLSGPKGNEKREGTYKREETLLRYSYHRFQEDSLNSRARQEYLSFDRLRYVLQHMNFDVVGKRERALTRRARSLVTADVAAYFSFDSLNDRLRVAGVHTSPWLEDSGQDFLNKWLADVARDPQRRKKSALYRCADTKLFQSKVIVNEKGHPWGSRLTEDVEQLNDDKKAWTITSKDLMAVPVQFHDRLQGVLYLMSGTPGRFRYYDRVRVLSFVQMFEAEIFRARLFLMLHTMNQELGRALRGDIAEKEFCDGLMEKLGSLLAVSGIVLWWRLPSDARRFRVLGHAGSRLDNQIPEGTEAPWSAFPFAKFSGEPRDLKLTYSSNSTQHLGGLHDLPWPHCTCLPLTDLENTQVVGAVTLHHSSRILVSEYLEDELRFVRDELRQTLEEYMAHSRQIGDLRAMIGHEVQSALDHIDGRRQRLDDLSRSQGYPRTAETEMAIHDLESNVQRARIFLDFLTLEPADWEAKYTKEAPFFWPYRLLNLKLDQPISVDDAVKTALHGRAVELRARNISFDFGGRKPPALWLDSREVGTIFSNLVDNVVKYGAPGQRIIVEYGRDQLEFFVGFRCRGLFLSEELRNESRRIFEKGMRGLPSKSARILRKEKVPAGTGKGLWTARELVRLWDGDIELVYRHGEPWAEYVFTVSFSRWLMSDTNPWPTRK